MAISQQPVSSNDRRSTEYSGAVSTWLSKFGSDLLATAKSVVKATQTARMMSVLAKMSDRQLAEIGIKRSEIARYAKRLMEDEQGGNGGGQRSKR